MSTIPGDGRENPHRKLTLDEIAAQFGSGQVPGPPVPALPPLPPQGANGQDAGTAAAAASDQVLIPPVPPVPRPDEGQQLVADLQTAGEFLLAFAGDIWPREDQADDRRKAMDLAFRLNAEAGRRSQARTTARTAEADETAFWEARAELAVIRDWARARLVSPWALLAEVSARVVAALPAGVMLPATVGSRVGAGLYALIVSPSGVGKSSAHGVAAEVLPVPGLYCADLAGTGEGVTDHFVEWVKDGESGERVEGAQPSGGGRLCWRNRSVLLFADEIEAVAAMFERKGTTLASFMRAGWNSARYGFSYRDKAKRTFLPPLGYRVCATVGATPDLARVLLDRADDGTPQRWAFLPGTDPHMPAGPAVPEPGSSLAAWHPPVAPQHPVIIPESVREHIRQHHVRRHRGEITIALLDAHANLSRLKWALALAALREGLEPRSPAAGRYEVTEEDWRLAGVIMAKSDQVRGGLLEAARRKAEKDNAARGRSEGQRDVAREDEADERRTDAAAGRIMERLMRNGEWTPGGPLRNALSRPQREVFDDAIARLTEENLIESRETGRDDSGHGGKGTEYRVRKQE